MSLDKIIIDNARAKSADDSIIARAKHVNPIIEKVNELSSSSGTVVADTISEKTSGSGVTVDGVVLKDSVVTADLTGDVTGNVTGSIDTTGEGKVLSATVTEYDVDVLISADEIVGTDAGDLGHADGVPLVAAPGAGYVLQFVNAVLIYDYDTAAYTGGAGDDLTIYINGVAVSPSIATADLITKAGDTVINLSALSAADYVLGVNSTINLKSTAVTNPGTAAGVIRAKVTYRKIATGL